MMKRDAESDTKVHRRGREVIQAVALQIVLTIETSTRDGGGWRRRGMHVVSISRCFLSRSAPTGIPNKHIRTTLY
jgi:hypothetical protein